MPQISENMLKKMVDDLQEKYNKILATFSTEQVKKARRVLDKSSEEVHQTKENVSLNIETMNEEVKPIIQLMRQFEDEIKRIYLENGGYLTHITDVAPENMRGGKILKSKNRANNYETERGDWTFASSSPTDGRNPYLARTRGGMILIEKNAYVYGGDNIEVKTDENGKKRAILGVPNYIYKINPKKFRPVTILNCDRLGNSYFEFSEEWISNDDVDINNKEEVIGVEKITDVTELLKNYQVFCDVNREGIGMKIRTSRRGEALHILQNSIQNGNLRYINGEADINLSPLLGDFTKKNVESNQEIPSESFEYCK